MTLPSVTQFPAIAFKRGVTDRVYKDHSELLWAIVDVMKAELAQLSREGVNYIQIDAPRYSYYIDPKWRSGSARRCRWNQAICWMSPSAPTTRCWMRRAARE